MTVLRLYITDSVEDTMRSICERKKKTADGLLLEDSARGLDLRTTSLKSIAILRKLFAKPNAGALKSGPQSLGLGTGAAASAHFP